MRTSSKDAETNRSMPGINLIDHDSTTDNHTTAFAQSLAHLFGLDSSPFLELLVRGVRHSFCFRLQFPLYRYTLLQ